MRAYDGIDYHYKHNDAKQEESIQIIANLIGFEPVPDKLLYSLNFYAGGTGVDDRAAVQCRIDEASWPVVAQKLRLRHYVDAAQDQAWGEDFRWLIGAEDIHDSVDEYCYQFINSRKLYFQDRADEKWEIFFADESDVNSWCVVWQANGRLNYLSFDQG